MTRQPDGGPAFPRPVSEDRKLGDQFDGNMTVPEQDGMSLRDYFAAKAMHAEFLSAGSFEGPAKALARAAEENDQTIEQRIAFNAYRLADAMLIERETGR